MKKFMKIAGYLGVTIIMVSHTGTAFGVGSKNLKAEDDKEKIHPFLQNVVEESLRIDAASYVEGSAPNSKSENFNNEIDEDAMRLNLRARARKSLKYKLPSFINYTSPDRLKLAEWTSESLALSSFSIAKSTITSDSEPASTSTSTSAPEDDNSYSNLPQLIEHQSIFCGNKSFSVSVLKMLSEGLSRDVRKDLAGLYTSKLDTNIDNIGFMSFLSIFSDFILVNRGIEDLIKEDYFFRAIDHALVEKSLRPAGADPFISHSKQIDAGEYLRVLFDFIEAGDLPCLASKIVHERKEKDTDNINKTMKDNIPEDAFKSYQVITCNGSSKNKTFSQLFECMHKVDSQKTDDEVFFHADIDKKFSHLIIKFPIFEKKSESNGTSSFHKADQSLRDTINTGEEVIIDAFPLELVGKAKRNQAVKLKLTPVAVVGHSGETPDSGHYIAKIKENASDAFNSWVMYSGYQPSSEGGRRKSDIGKSYDDYIVVYKVEVLDSDSLYK